MTTCPSSGVLLSGCRALVAMGHYFRPGEDNCAEHNEVDGQICSELILHARPVAVAVAQSDSSELQAAGVAALSALHLGGGGLSTAVLRTCPHSRLASEALGILSSVEDAERQLSGESTVEYRRSPADHLLGGE